MYICFFHVGLSLHEEGPFSYNSADNTFCIRNYVHSNVVDKKRDIVEANAVSDGGKICP